MSETRNHCPSHPNPHCPKTAGEGQCELCGYDFSVHMLDRDALLAARSKARIRGEQVRNDKAQAEIADLKRQLAAAQEKRAAASHQAEESPQSKPKFNGQVFRDADWAPEMVVLPKGSFMMGSPYDEEGRSRHEGPQHRVEIGHSLAIGKYAVTFDEYDHYARETGLALPGDAGWGRGRRPVINVSWGEAQIYIEWLNEKLGLTGRPDAYRLPSEAEWEYACRAGTTGPFSFNGLITPRKANYDSTQSYGGSPMSEMRGKTVEVGSLPANPWGLHEMHGNVWEWVEDCWHYDYEGAPTDGQVWVGGDCSFRAVRGGSWNYDPRGLRAAIRYDVAPGDRYYDLGFRVARTVSP